MNPILGAPAWKTEPPPARITALAYRWGRWKAAATNRPDKVATPPEFTQRTPPEEKVLGMAARPEVGSVKLPEAVLSEVCTATFSDPERLCPRATYILQ